MKLISKISDIRTLRGGAVTIGNFDGVHRGHAKIIEQLRQKAQKCGGPAVVFTFDPHPVRLLRPHHAPPPLTWLRRKAGLLEELGVDGLIAYPTDYPLLELSPREFFEQIVVEQLGARAIVEGPNFYFGKDRAGDVDVLRDLCQAHRLELSIVEPLRDGEAGESGLVSSSRIRAAVSKGDVESARHMLTQPYRLRGMVMHGEGRGVKIGFPTANLDAIDTLVPAQGVYAGSAYLPGVPEGIASAIHIGPNPTFHEHADKVEIHLIDFEDNLYGEPLEVDFLTRLRDIHPFPDVEALKQQLQADVNAAREAT